MKISIDKVLDETTLVPDLTKYMESKGYKDNEVALEVEGSITKLSLRTQVETDEQVNSLSKDIQSVLVEKGYIKSASEVVEQSIT